MAGVYLHNLIKKTPYMKSARPRLVGCRNTCRLHPPEFFCWYEFTCSKRVFQFIPVAPGLAGADNGGNFRQNDLPDPVQVIANLFLLVKKLFLVREHLPLAAPANPEMVAERHYPVGRKRMYFQGMP